VSHIYALQDVLEKTDAIISTDSAVPSLFVTDASSSHSFIYLADGSFSYVADFPFSPDEAAASSSYRELLALYRALHTDEQVFRSFASQLVYWQTDNQACVRFLHSGSRQPQIQRIVLSIKTVEKNLNIRILPVWTPRCHTRIVAADAGSRFATSTDEWFIDRTSLTEVFQLLSFFPGPNCIDCFASAANNVCAAFYSLIPQVGTIFSPTAQLRPTSTYVLQPHRSPELSSDCCSSQGSGAFSSFPAGRRRRSGRYSFLAASLMQ
jgi:hypothetical protein